MESGVTYLLRRSLLIAESVESDVADLLRGSLLIAEVMKNNVVVLFWESGTADPLGCSFLNTRSATGKDCHAKSEACDGL